MKSFIVFILFFFLISNQIGAQQQSDADVFVPITKYIQNGDAESLSAWFAKSLEIDILGSINISSKNQAKQVMRDFFNNYTPKNFVIIHKSGKSPMKYAIGNLNAGGSKFRVTLFVKIQEDGNYIQSIRIEKE